MKAEKEHIDELIVSYLSNELDGNAVHELKLHYSARRSKSEKFKGCLRYDGMAFEK